MLIDYNVRNDEGKAVLGDLMSGYLNSFGAFVSRGRDRGAIDRMVKSTTLAEFKQSLGGEAAFEAAVTESDRVNEGLIALYRHHPDRLAEILDPSEHGLLKELRPLTDILYWRRKPS